MLIWYGIEFDFRSCFSVPVFNWDRNFVIFGVDNSSSVHIDSKKKDILVHGKGPTHGLDDTSITAEAEFSINMSRSQKKKNCLNYSL